ncbi:RAD3-like DEAD/DEAH box helicase [Tamilnaduibacter salinus]|uniref:RAD3-like DEAD/DEAH box helicase n=1 Tax=Tamilnaduibacter salinus TaxID=1484056 RepID=A0A2U1CXW7_9GAMM|nr:helicase-related protein [Tamilnaduibacter salinus]PVY77323.1 RAD3-like DEAD/DEAH box helicase [Tamilnaduibacter salinus]
MATHDTLPIETLRDDVQHALRLGHVVVSAATGSGKSTRLPVWASREHGPVLVVEPRRVACTALAGFVAKSEGESLGEGVGYAIRFDQAFTPDTRILFVTPGIALRWFRDGDLARFGTVILDEFHERRWDTDLLLAMLQKQGRQRLVVTSATLDGPRLADYLEAPLLTSEGRGFPVSVGYQSRDDRQMPSLRDLPHRASDAVHRALSTDDGDVLVFMPGRREIQQTVSALQSVDADVIAMHANAPPEDQKRALNVGQRRRVIVSTNVAETSLTIPGVTWVIDSGLERRTHQRNGRTVLSLAPISQANADQRKGRAGRTAPGQAIRLWGERAPLEALTRPEIQREELTDLVLAAACGGYAIGSLRFADALPDHTLTQARDQLHQLGALDDEDRTTERGRALFSLPVDTFFAHLIIAMPDEAGRGFIVDLAAALSAHRRPLRLPRSEDGRKALNEWQAEPCDATTLVAAIRSKPPSETQPHAAARDEARKLARQMRRILALPDLPSGVDEPVGTILRHAVRARPDAVFVRREKHQRREAMGNGREECWIGDDSRFSGDAEAALVFDSHSIPGKGTRQTITLATCLAPVPLEALVETGLAEAESGPMEWEDDTPWVTRQWRYADRIIHTEQTQPEGEAAREVLARLILNGNVLPPAGERLNDDIAAWALYVGLGHGKGEVPEPFDWLVDALATLGVESLDDRALLEADDLRFNGVPEWERPWLDDKYPRTVRLADLKMRIHYRVAAKQVIAEYMSGNRKGDPKRWELPVWSGWTVKYRKASRVVDIR